MNRLFIIGNGFDKAHGYKTSYLDFKKWLLEQMDAMKLNAYPPEIPYSTIDNHGETVYDKEKLIKFLMWLFAQNESNDPEWCHFEDYLYYLDLQEALDSWTDEYDGSNDCHDNDIFHTEYNFEDNAQAISEACGQIGEVFDRWIKSIDIPETRISFGDVIDSYNSEPLASDLFLTFNYTETLEKNYSVPDTQVCHIHGYRKNNENLIVGHGNSENRKFNHKHPSAADELSSAISSLRKNVDVAIENHAWFWDKLNAAAPIDEIYNFGWSFSEVDRPYLIKIMETIGNTEKTVFYLNAYDDNKIDGPDNGEYRKIIIECGFKGQFGIY